MILQNMVRKSRQDFEMELHRINDRYKDLQKMDA